MTKQVSDGEFRGVTALSGPKRYEHFVSRVADFEEVWSLHSSSGLLTMGDAAGHNCVPVWPHKRYAESFIRDEWSQAEAKSIDLYEWMDRWLPGMARDGMHVAVFPVDKQEGVIVTPQELERDLQAELEQYEDNDPA